MDWTQLDPDHRLTYLLGDIVRDDVFAENEAGGVWNVLVSASTTKPEKAPWDLSRLLDDAKDLLKALTLDDYARQMTHGAIVATINAHVARNGPVHNYWMHQGAHDERWTSIRMLTSRKDEVPATPQNLSEFVKCRDNLLFAAWRMRAVSIVLPSWLDVESFGDQLEEDGRRWWTAVAVGKFNLSPGAGLTDAQVDDTIQLAPRWTS